MEVSVVFVALCIVAFLVFFPWFFPLLGFRAKRDSYVDGERVVVSVYVATNVAVAVIYAVFPPAWNKPVIFARIVSPGFWVVWFGSWVPPCYLLFFFFLELGVHNCVAPLRTKINEFIPIADHTFVC